MEYEVEPDASYLNVNNKRHAPSGGGRWVKRFAETITNSDLPHSSELNLNHVQGE